ncbi:RsmB/NOP family class I SAM-dependent RNA methyltransferase [Paenibacillus sp. GSMTC-2017]|uniref:RsmB/NOP family class I SAM-dependent RNA methyltransferase n=1 Tax=Paenibacillus sp. GSMTC-2017 TaxID=2794350 RepID=UPI0018D5E1E1|nr:RsmB/NOP family class I SAM-dependent RNA methyltransferase [Paenibacillus sp. GSMTC-2017]MBH5318183.1 RsmB/NOP family class I SAM-dependent RNA methyltransferase [Paenibacillus sp. GSMTC-2017]
MKSILPAKFLNKMESLLQDEFESFMASYEAPRVYGLRVNPLKATVEEWSNISPMRDRIRSIPWTKDGLYYTEEDRPGKHPHYHAGLYYIQEPSAMLPVELLDVRPGHRVLDLCAAPGGKSTQIAGKLMGKGVLVTNDNAFERTKALAKNIELAGVRNAVILNEEPSNLAPVFEKWFDRILVDAPCSGEGMFRKDESMAADWEKHSIEKCSVMQRDILTHAAEMLKPGGIIVYSTCTFSPEENEDQIAAFLADQPEFTVEPVQHKHGLGAGRPDWVEENIASKLGANAVQSLEGTVRIWPHKVEGEGHYVAILKRSDQSIVEIDVDTADVDEEQKYPIKKKAKGQRNDRLVRGGKAPEVEVDPAEVWSTFKEQHLNMSLNDTEQTVIFGAKVYIGPKGFPSLDGLRVVRAGWLAGESIRGRFHPSQALALGLKPEEAARRVSWRSDEEEVIRYLKGETLFVDRDKLILQSGALPKGYTLICVDGYPLGWGKYADGMLKNELSAGWRLV